MTEYEMIERTDAPYGSQAILDFGSYQLSIVQHDGSYGGKQGLFEIGVFKDSNMVELPGITADGDTVKGYLSESEVNGIITKMFTITRKTPTQV